jgi:hypothetical protein
MRFPKVSPRFKYRLDILFEKKGIAPIFKTPQIQTTKMGSTALFPFAQNTTFLYGK